MRDLVEARGDVALHRPLVAVRWAGEGADLGDRVVRAPVGSKPVRAGQEVRLEDRFEHQLQRGLHYPVSHGGDPQPALLPVRLRDHPFAHGKRTELSSLQLIADLGEERIHSAPLFDSEGRVTVHAGGSGAPVAPHPLPCHQQERGIADEIEQIMKLLVWIVGCPTGQFGLDLPYPSLRAIQRELPLVGIHRRTPGIPASALRACWSPSPCTRLSRARTTTRPPPHSTVIGRLRACPSASRPERREGDRGWFPRSPEPIDEGGVQLNPGSLATSTPQTFLVASSPAYPF